VTGVASCLFGSSYYSARLPLRIVTLALANLPLKERQRRASHSLIHHQANHPYAKPAWIVGTAVLGGIVASNPNSASEQG
jgi:hypothetical protein